MKTKKRPTKRRKKIVPNLFLLPKHNTTTNVYLEGQTIWYPTMPPRKTTWITRIKEALTSLWGLI